MNEDIISEDSIGIFTEAQRTYSDPIEDDVLADDVKILSSPAYTPGWGIFEKAVEEQITSWNNVTTLNLNLSAEELKQEVVARQLASDFIMGFKQTVLLAVQEKERHEAN